MLPVAIEPPPPPQRRWALVGADVQLCAFADRAEFLAKGQLRSDSTQDDPMRRAISWFPLFFLPGLHMAVRHAPRAWQFATSASERALSYEGHSSPAQPSEASAPVRRRRVRWGGPRSARSSGQGPPQRTARPFHTRRRTPGAWVAILCSHPSCSTRARRTSESLLSRPWRLAIGRVLATRPWRTVLS